MQNNILRHCGNDRKTTFAVNVDGFTVVISNAIDSKLLLYGNNMVMPMLLELVDLIWCPVRISCIHV